MIKSFLILISFSVVLVASKQIILVVADDFNTSKAQLECYEDSKKIFKTIDVNLGKNGLGWGLGKEELKQLPSDSIKYEGDKKAPSGVLCWLAATTLLHSISLHSSGCVANTRRLCTR